jgi:hypothetical protein
MYYNAVDQDFRCGENGQWIACTGLVNAAQGVSAAITNTTTMTNFSGATNDSYVIPSGGCAPGAVYQITAAGLYSDSVTSGSALKMVINLNGTSTTIGSSGARNPVSTTTASSEGWYLTTTMTCYTSSGTTYINIGGTAMFDNNAFNTNGYAIVNNGSGSPPIAWPSGANTLYVGAQWSTATTNASIKMTQFVVTRQGP